MDGDKDDKSIVRKTVEAVKGFAASVSDAAHKALEPVPQGPHDEVVVIPMQTAGIMGETATPPFVVIHQPKKKRAKTAKKATKSAKATPKKNAKKSNRKAKTTTARNATGKRAKRTLKKAKKSRR